jgi:hypothetical protein
VHLAKRHRVLRRSKVISPAKCRPEIREPIFSTVRGVTLTAYEVSAHGNRRDYIQRLPLSYIGQRVTLQFRSCPLGQSLGGYTKTQTVQESLENGFGCLQWGKAPHVNVCSEDSCQQACNHNCDSELHQLVRTLKVLTKAQSSTHTEACPKSAHSGRQRANQQTQRDQRQYEQWDPKRIP